MEKNEEAQWVVVAAEDTENGKPLIFRFIKAPPEGIELASYPHLLTVHWSYSSPNESGMPNEDENLRMELLEDLLDIGLEKSANAYLTVIVTGNEVKEWQWYSRNVEETLQLLNEALADCEEFPIEISCEDDPEWSSYSEIIELAQ